MSDMSGLKNERERLFKKYERNSKMLNMHIEVTKEYYETCKELDQKINAIDEVLEIFKHIKSL